MNAHTQALWEMLDEALDSDTALLEDLKKIVFKEYTPFLNAEQTLETNIHALKVYFLDHMNTLIAWLPDTTMNACFSALVEGAMKEIYWSFIAAMLEERLTPDKETAPCRK